MVSEICGELRTQEPRLKKKAMSESDRFSKSEF